MHKIKGAALIVLVLTAMIFATIPALISLSKAADSGWTLVNDSSNIKAYPNLHEYVWQKNTSTAPNSINDKIGLHRLVKTGTTPSAVIFIMPSAFSSPKNSSDPMPKSLVSYPFCFSIRIHRDGKNKPISHKKSSR